MEVALCLSGQPRLFKRGYKYIKNFLVDEYNIQDIFCHFWWDKDQNTQGNLASWNYIKHYESGHKGGEFSSEGDILNELKTLYNPIYIEYDNPPKNVPLTYEQINSYLTKYSHKEPNWELYPEEYKQYLYIHLKSILDSQFQVSHFKRMYEQNRGKKYDLVIRTRYDFALNVDSPKKWKGKFGNFPSLYEIENKLKENSNYIFTEWDNLWMYSSEIHDKMIEGMWWNFDELFNFIVSNDESNLYKESPCKGIPEHLQGIQAHILKLIPELEIGIDCGLVLPRTEEEFNIVDLKWNL
jgi:hypothetical protein